MRAAPTAPLACPSQEGDVRGAAGSDREGHRKALEEVRLCPGRELGLQPVVRRWGAPDRVLGGACGGMVQRARDGYEVCKVIGPMLMRHGSSSLYLYALASSLSI